MRRKLCSVLLSAFALLLLMGAASYPEDSATILAQEESAAAVSRAALETEVNKRASTKTASGAVEMNIFNGLVSELREEAAAVAVQSDAGLLVDGAAVPASVNRTQKHGVTYVALSEMAKTLDPSVQSNWDSAAKQVTITSPKLKLTAKVGQQYVVANGRYLYVPETVQNINGVVVVPLSVVTKAFDATLNWNSSTGVVHVTRGSGAIQSGDSYYNQDDLFWLARVIYAESGNQSLDGKIAVGNVILNRVESHLFPNSILGVLSQKNQFSTYKNGGLAKRTPNESSVIAAKLTLEGAVVEKTEGALYFDSLVNSWASRQKQYVATIGGHKFYR